MKTKARLVHWQANRKHSHDHGSGHSCSGHHHSHAPTEYGRIFAFALVLNIALVAGEAIGGALAGSLGLFADAGHNLSDVLGLALAWGAHELGSVAPTKNRTFGWRSSTLLAALANGMLLLIAMGILIWEAVHRFWDPAPVAGITVMVVAGIAAVLNILTALLFMKGRKSDLNLRGAYLHMIADAGVSVAVVVAGGLQWITHWQWVDPVVSLFIAAVILWGTYGLLRESVNLLLMAVPENVDLPKVIRFLEQKEGVTDVHDVHVWAMSTTENAMTAHVTRPGEPIEDDELHQWIGDLRQHFALHHITLQVERGSIDCTCPLTQR